MGECFLCGVQTSTCCPYCGEFACSQVHYEYHRPPGEETTIVLTKPTTVNSSNCHPFRCLKGAKGRYLVATRLIKPLGLVMSDRPCMVGPPAKTSPVCLECLTPLQEMMWSACPECRVPLCGPPCYNGPNHKPECQLLTESKTARVPEVSNLKEPHLFYSAIFPIRCWLLQKYNPSEWEKVNFLQEGNMEELTSSDMWSTVLNYMKNDVGIEEIPTSELLRLEGIKGTNANSIETPSGEAAGLFPLYPLMNSYCYCNTRYSIDPDTKLMDVRAQLSIECGEEITTRYIAPTLGQPERIKTIWSQWGFICNCRRCSDPTELGSYFSAIVCKECSVGYLLPSKPLTLCSTWVCDHCFQEKKEDVIEKVVQHSEFLIIGSKLKDTEKCEKLLSNLRSYLHENHFLLIKVKNKLLQLYDETENKSRPILDRMSQLAVDVLKVFTLIDPGLTSRRGVILKYLVDVIMLRANMDFSEGAIDRKTLNRTMRDSMKKIKEMMLCLKYDITIVNNFA